MNKQLLKSILIRNPRDFRTVSVEDDVKIVHALPTECKLIDRDVKEVSFLDYLNGESVVANIYVLNSPNKWVQKKIWYPHFKPDDWDEIKRPPRYSTTEELVHDVQWCYSKVGAEVLITFSDDTTLLLKRLRKYCRKH